MRELRDYQAEGIEAVNEAWAGGLLRPAVVMATGLGKTDLIAHAAATRVRAGHRVLVLAHRFALLRQITARCRMWLPDRGPSVAGIVAGEIDQRNRPVVAAMVPTMRSKGRRVRFEPYGPGDLVIVDECHHAAAKSYLDVLEWAGCFDETSGVSTFGVTATMYQSGARGGRTLADVWQKVVYERGLRWAVDHGWLVRPRGLAVVADHLDLSKVKTRAGDYSEEQIGELVAQDADQIADAWVEHASDRITVGFFPTRESVEAQRAAFARRGVSCEVVLGDTPEAVRGDVASGTGIYGRLARGETRIMLGLMVPTEGWDCPPVSCVLMARPTKIEGLYQQCVGRGLRLSPGKADCLVLDVVGVARVATLRTLADLVPGVEYGETQPRACGRCGRYKRPEDRTEPRCVCPPEVERDPTGGRRELLGPQVYEEVDLFGQDVADTGNGVLWLRTRGGVAFVPAKDRIGTIAPEPGGTWRAGHVHRDRFEKGVRLVSGATLNEAKAAVEAWAMSYTEATYWSARAPWRRAGNPPSEGQLRAAVSMGLPDADRYNRAAVSDFLSVRAANRRLDRR